MAIREEVKDHGVSVTALLPGVTATDFFNKADMEDSKILETGQADPADVAKSGYDALMAGEDMVIHGMKNKMQVGMANMMPDSMTAKNMYKQQEPKDKE
jgi:short-subunit dehydrogenase